MPTKKEHEKDFAAKMKLLREKKKISIEKLAAAAGVSAEYLEQIEQRKVMPPVSDIIRISSMLTVDSGAFLSKGDEESKRKRAESFDRRQKAYSYKTLTPDAAHKHMKAFMVTIDPGKEHEKVEYTHPGEEFIYVLDGGLDIEVGRDEHRLKKGQSIHFDSGKAHRLRNHGKKRCELIVVVYTP